MNHTDMKITDTLRENYMPYAMSVIISRALPEIDGFKPSHRKLLYTMYKMNLIKGQKTKSANVVGQTMKLNPHGDGAIYETMVRLTRGNESLLHPFVDSKGNFAKHYSRDMAYAASRYTEVKLDEICSEVFKDIDKNTVDFTDNYDGTMKEPTLLPVTFPNILVNPNQGIAVGMANNICSFNLAEVCKTTIAYLKNPKCDISKTLIAPDFSTGGQLIYDKDALDQIYKTGRGSVKLRSKYRHDKKNSVIEIFEIPYTTTAEAIIDKIIDLIKIGKVKEITDIRDESDKSGLKITLDIKKSTDVSLLMSKLFKMTSLEDSFSCNFNILIGTAPKVMGIAEILENWTKFRLECLKRKIKYDINKLTHRLHLMEGLKQILLDIDKAIKIIRDTEKDEDVVPNLMKGFKIDEIQADFIADIKLRNLNKEYILKRIQDVDDLNKELDRLDAILKDDSEIKKIIIDELKDISKKFGIERKTEVIYEDEVETFDESAAIEDYNLRIFLTKGNYLKKISHVSLRSSGAHKLKEEDYMLCEWDSTNKSELILISDKQNAYKIRLHEIADCKASELGHYIPNIIEMEPDEKIVYAIPTLDYHGDLLFVFENGKGARVSMKCYETKTNRKKLVNAYYGKSKLVGVKFIEQEEDIVIYSSLDKIVIFNTSLMQTKTTRDTMGVALMNMKKKSTLARVEYLKDVKFADPSYYTARNIPASGYYLKDDDYEDTQLSLF
ncbi:MAG: topoisomerase IV [Ruminococcaceae bacterium]|nr:topoisomerase IV [Oscillospiraceae bacterium]